MPFFYSKILLLLLASEQYATALRLGTDLTIGDEPAGTENFPSYVECGGQQYILTRVETGNYKGQGWDTRVRVLEGNKFKIKGTYRSPMSHNLASLCVDGKIYMMGGQWRPGYKGGKKHWTGIHQVLVPNLVDEPFNRSQLTLALTGNSTTTGCVENRPDQLNNCEFDGKFSLNHKEGAYEGTYMYARTNIALGKRWVQVTSSKNNKDWSRFKQIEIEGLDKDKEGTNVYFFNCEDWNSTHKAGIFPAVIPGASGIFLTFSTDMIHWTRPTVIKKLDPVNLARQELRPPGQRVSEYPVGLLNKRLLTMKRHWKFQDAFTISDAPISEFGQSHFSPYPVEIE